ncbi:MAG TPA: MerR family transcriptional regulator [Streptosporangiaceae bacterium]|nr:MerR family transcriptional regulator [Streptosporangiaceae bacterium]
MTYASGGRITVPTELAALAAGVTVATIRKWASRGKLTRYGSPGRAEYDIDELQELVANHHGPPRSRVRRR